MPKRSQRSNDKLKSDQIPGRRERPTAFPIAGIGASAGGLEAFTELIGALPANTGIAYVLVQHLDPRHESALPNLLARATKMPVLEARQNARVLPDHIYVIRPNTSLTISDGVLRVATRKLNGRQHMPIDIFLRSLAEDKKTASIGIILSGTASDGVLGLRSIKAEGGLAFAQSPASAKFDGMPQSAIAAGCVDFVLPPKGIAQELTRIMRHPYVNGRPSEEIENPSDGDARALNEILAILQRSKRTDFSHYRISTVQRRIARRMAVHDIQTRQEFANHLRRHPEAVEALFQDLLICVTSFFREPDKYKVLVRRILPKILKDAGAVNSIRVWVPGCSTGEEAYSIAIAITEFLATKGATSLLQIFATDLSDQAVQKAREGKYPLSIEADVGPERLKRFFSKRGSTYQISKRIRDVCMFAEHDLTVDPPFSNMDLISCCNVLIYMSPIIQRKILGLFHYALKPSGFLILGKAESTTAFPNAFERADRKQPLYSKKPLGDRADFPAVAQRGIPEKMPQKMLPEFAPAADPDKEMDRMILERYSPPGFMVNEHLQILRFRGNVGPYLDPKREEEASLNLMKMVRPGFAFELRAAVHHAKAKNTVVRREGVRIADRSSARLVAIEVIPFGPHQAREPLFLILIEELAPVSGAHAGDRKHLQKGNNNLATLKRELVATKAYLHSVIEEQEASNEELKSVSEEIQARNEELQSSNEELETTKEELQSANEELSTLNDTLGARNADLDKLNLELDRSLHSARDARHFSDAIIETVSQPLVVLDSDLRLIKANRAFYRLFSIRPAEAENHLFYEIGNRQWDIPELRHALEDILPLQQVLADFSLEKTFDPIGLRSLVLNARRLQGTEIGNAIFISIEDVTERKNFERERAKLESLHLERAEADAANHAKDLFLAMVSHELRTPLGVIVGWCEILKRRQLSEAEQPAAMEALDRNARQLTRLVDDLLDVSRIVSGTLRLSLATVPLDAIVRSVADDFRRPAEAKSIALNVETLTKRSFVRGDPARLQQIVKNIISNAVKFTPPGGKVSVRLSAEGSLLHLSVRDTGPGIRPDFLPYLFNPFRQSEQGMTSRDGLGLGLAIARNLAELHGGTIRVESPKGGGSDFVFEIPAAETSLSGLERPANEADLPRLDGVHVLCVDDHADTRTVVTHILSESGAQVIAVESAAEALEKIRKQKPDIVLADLSMPGDDGYALLRKMRAMRGHAGNHMPVVALSALVSEDEQKRAIQAGFQEFVGKPIDRARLIAVLANTLKEARTS